MQEQSVNKSNAAQVALHILLWLSFLLLPAFFRPSGSGHDFGTTMFSDLFVPHRAINGIYLIVVFYCNYYIAFPKLYFRRRYGAFLAYVLATILLLIVVNFVIVATGLAHPPPGRFDIFGASHNLYLFIIMYIFSLSISVFTQWRKVQEEKMQAEISFLNAQINPHFLFNALNSIYSLTLDKSDDASEAVLILSRMMRYTTEKSGSDMVPLDKAVAYIDDYVALQQIRLSDNVKVKYVVRGSREDKQIAPLLLVPFVENTFKHGVSTAEQVEIIIDISINGDNLNLTTINRIFNESNDCEGIGLSNTKKRLELLYPKKHSLAISRKDGYFRVSLDLLLK